MNPISEEHDRKINLNTAAMGKGRSQFNIILNTVHMDHGYDIRNFHQSLSGLKAIVIAAGPSLDKNIEKAKNTDAVIIVVDTALRTCLHYGIAPHFIVTVDPTPFNCLHFDGIDDLGDAFLVFHPECNWRILNRYKNHPYKIGIIDKDSFYINHVFNINKFLPYVRRAMNSGHVAFNFAHFLGCNPIILAGFDYAFEGRTHTKDASLSREVIPIGNNGEVAIKGIQGKVADERGFMVEVSGYNGSSVLTSPIFYRYIQDFQRDIQRLNWSCPNIINATEGGAKIEGTKQLPLVEALQLEINGIVQSEFKKLRLNPVMEYCLKYYNIDVLHRYLNSIIPNLEKMYDISCTVESINHKTTPVDVIIQEIKRIEIIWQSMAGSELFRIAMGSSVFYIQYQLDRFYDQINKNGEVKVEKMASIWKHASAELKMMVKNMAETIEISVTMMKENELNAARK